MALLGRVRQHATQRGEILRHMRGAEPARDFLAHLPLRHVLRCLVAAEGDLGRVHEAQHRFLPVSQPQREVAPRAALATAAGADSNRRWEIGRGRRSAETRLAGGGLGLEPGSATGAAPEPESVLQGPARGVRLDLAGAGRAPAGMPGTVAGRWEGR